MCFNGEISRFQAKNANIQMATKSTILTLFGAEGVFRDPFSCLFAITLRAFERTLWNLVTFPKILHEIRWNKKFFKIGNHGHVIWE